MYCDASDDYYPDAYADGDAEPYRDASGNELYWTEMVLPYIGGDGVTRRDFQTYNRNSNNVFNCPSQTVLPFYGEGNPHRANDGRYVCYGFNEMLYWRWNSLKGSGKSHSVRRLRLPQPDITVGFADSHFNGDPNATRVGYFMLAYNRIHARHPGSDDPYRGGFNVAWCDGHVSTETFTTGVENTASADNCKGWFWKYSGYPYTTAAAPIQ